MKYGLSDTTIEKICGVFKQFSSIEKVMLYGSRAKGNYKNGSDIDLTLIGTELNHSIHLKVMGALDELLLPYTIDLSVFNELHHKSLEDHIQRVGVVFYQRK